MPKKRFLAILVTVLSAASVSVSARTPSPLLTLDEFFNAVSYRDVEVSPDGLAVAIETVRPNWEEGRFRHDLWLYRRTGSGKGSLAQITRSGYDHSPQWSPDSRWIAFLSDYPAPEGVNNGPTTKDSDNLRSGETPQREEPGTQIYMVGIDGGEPVRLTDGAEGVHAFSWSKDSRSIYFASPVPLPPQQQSAYRREWKDAIRVRESEREDLIHSIDVSPIVTHPPHPGDPLRPGERNNDLALRSQVLSRTPYRVKRLVASSDGRRLAFATEPRSRRQDSLYGYGIYLLDLPRGQVRLLSHTEAIYDAIHWAPNNRHVFFSVVNGSVEGPYQDRQPRVYTVDMIGEFTNAGGPTTRWMSNFGGAITDYAATSTGALIAAGRLGTEVQIYTQTGPATELVKRSSWPGTYGHLSAAQASLRIAFVHSSLGKPPEVYVADNPDSLDQAVQITAFNHLFTERELPQGKPYHWTTDDGVTAEGVLIYPPGRFGGQRLTMLTLIHGGPEDADGNSFEANWYQWSALAATQGWLVFRPNYRGSVGYGDAFTLGRVPHILSRPGKDILEGIDALVKDGIADPDHLTVGGYGYGGTITNWLITQTTRFKAAVSGAGAVEHVCHWGNDGTSFDDAYSLGGAPWEAEKNYNDEAAIFQLGKVRTPTHIVAGANDSAVEVGENRLLERALHTRDVPATLLVFPGEGHGLDQNPWHGKIKVREELKWLQKYGR